MALGDFLGFMELSFSRGRVGLECLPTYEMADVAGGRS